MTAQQPQDATNPAVPVRDQLSAAQHASETETVAEPRVVEITTQCKNCLCGIRWEPALGEFVHWLNNKPVCPTVMCRCGHHADPHFPTRDGCLGGCTDCPCPEYRTVETGETNHPPRNHQR